MRIGLMVLLLGAGVGLSACGEQRSVAAEGASVTDTAPVTTTQHGSSAMVRNSTEEIALGDGNDASSSSDATSGFGGEQPGSAGAPTFSEDTFGGEQESSAGDGFGGEQGISGDVDFGGEQGGSAGF